MSHLGYIYGDEAKGVLDEAVLICETWWHLFEENAGKLDDVDYTLENVMRESSLGIPEIRILSPKIKVLFALMTGGRKLVGKRPQPLGELLLRGIIEQLTTGYRMHKKP